MKKYARIKVIYWYKNKLDQRNECPFGPPYYEVPGCVVLDMILSGADPGYGVGGGEQKCDFLGFFARVARKLCTFIAFTIR